MKTLTATKALDFQACWEIEQVVDALDRLDRLDQAARPWQGSERRRCERHRYLSEVLISPQQRLRSRQKLVLHVLSMNLSRSGIGLMVPQVFSSAHRSGSVQDLYSSSILGNSAKLELGLDLGSGKRLWVTGTIVRARTLQHDLIEIGVRFDARLKSSDVEVASHNTGLADEIIRCKLGLLLKRKGAAS